MPESQGNIVPSSEDTQQVVTGLIASIERRWLSYEEDKIYNICSLLDPRFKHICFSSFALVRLLLSNICAKSINPFSSSASVVIDAEDDQKDAPVKKKKCLWDSFDEELKKKKSTQLSTSQDKSCHHTAVLNTLIERRIFWHGGKYTRIATYLSTDIAREYLAIPAMSTPSERIFSAVGYISSKQISHLCRENINQLVLLNKNV